MYLPITCICPAVVSDIKCFHEVGGDETEYFNPYNVESIVESVSSMVYSEAKRHKSIAFGYERLKRFSWENTVSNHVELYNGLI